MKANVKVRPNMTIELEAETQKELFKEVASATEVFSETKCGVCGKENIRPIWRTVTQGKKVFEYPEYQCQESGCRAKLSLGSLMEGGGLFVVRKLDKDGKPDRENGKFGSHNGWHKYVPEPVKSE